MLFSIPLHRAAFSCGVALAGALSFLSPLQAQLKPRVAAPQVVKSWRPFSSKAGAFSVLLPAAPKSMVRSEGKNKVHVFYHAVPGSAYMVNYGDFREGGFSARQIQGFSTQGILDSNRNGLLMGARGKLVNERRLQWQNFPAREVVYDIPQLGIRARSLLVFARPFIYQVSALMPKNKATAPTVRAFLDSFQTRAPRS